MRLRHIRGAEETIATSPYVIQEPELHKGSWNQVFGNDNPIQIEVGMGKGRFIMELAQQNPDINYIGIERYSSVLLRAVEKYQSLETDGTTPPANIRFICMDANDICEVFAPKEVSRIYLNFSDPWPKARHARRRLTSREFFALYDKILTTDGSVEFKTDNHDLFDFSVEELADSKIFTMTDCTYDLHHDEVLNQGNIMTEYEEKFSSQGNPICKLIARRKASVGI